MMQTTPGDAVSVEVLILSDVLISLPACCHFQRRLCAHILLQLSLGTTQTVNALAGVVLTQPSCTLQALARQSSREVLSQVDS